MVDLLELCVRARNRVAAAAAGHPQDAADGLAALAGPRRAGLAHPPPHGQRVCGGGGQSLRRHLGRSGHFHRGQHLRRGFGIRSLLLAQIVSLNILVCMLLQFLMSTMVIVNKPLHNYAFLIL